MPKPTSDSKASSKPFFQYSEFAVPDKPTDAETTSKSGPDWSDPTILVGDSPPLPRWPLVASGVAWAAWLVFLIGMAVSRLQGGAS